MSNREPKLLLTDILDSINKIKVYALDHSFESFLAD